jgi:hypothetical protein
MRVLICLAIWMYLSDLSGWSPCSWDASSKSLSIRWRERSLALLAFLLLFTSRPSAG